jgi:hypothetical protein
MSDYTLSTWDLAVRLYEKSNAVGIALHDRPETIRSVWLNAAQRLIAMGAVPMDDITTPDTVN